MGDRNQKPMTLVIKVVFLVSVSKYKPAKVLRGKTFKLLFYQIVLKFPHNITIFALRYNKKANIR